MNKTPSAVQRPKIASDFFAFEDTLYMTITSIGEGVTSPYYRIDDLDLQGAVAQHGMTYKERPSQDQLLTQSSQYPDAVYKWSLLREVDIPGHNISQLVYSAVNEYGHT